jgi:hypothetical protein
MNYVYIKTSMYAWSAPTLITNGMLAYKEDGEPLGEDSPLNAIKPSSIEEYVIFDYDIIR